MQLLNQLLSIFSENSTLFTLICDTDIYYLRMSGSALGSLFSPNGLSLAQYHDVLITLNLY